MITKMSGKEKKYHFEIGDGRRTDRNFELLLGLRDEIEKGNLPILWVGKKRNAVIIDYDEFVKLKKLEEDFK